MRKTIFSLLLASFGFVSLIPSAEALVSVKGYYRSNGTYVQPHYRTSPNSTTSDNFSTNGIKTTHLSYSEAASIKKSLRTGVAVSNAYVGSKRERKVYACVASGSTEKACKAKYMPKKH